MNQGMAAQIGDASQPRGGFDHRRGYDGVARLGIGSAALAAAAAEQPLRHDDHDHDQDRHRDDVLVARGHRHDGKRFNQAKRQPAKYGTERIGEPAQDGGGKALER